MLFRKTKPISELEKREARVDELAAELERATEARDALQGQIEDRLKAEATGGKAYVAYRADLEAVEAADFTCEKIAKMLSLARADLHDLKLASQEDKLKQIEAVLAEKADVLSKQHTALDKALGQARVIATAIDASFSEHGQAVDDYLDGLRESRAMRGITGDISLNAIWGKLPSECLPPISYEVFRVRHGDLLKPQPKRLRSGAA